MDFLKGFFEVPDEEKEEGVYEYDVLNEPSLDEIPDGFGYIIHKKANLWDKGYVEIYSEEIGIREVFSTAEASSATYVSRHANESATYEIILSQEIDEPGRAIVVTGQSKIGKSSIWKHVLEVERDVKSVIVQCNNDMDTSDIYEHVLNEIGVSVVTGVKTKVGESSSHDEEISAGVGVASLKGGLKSKNSALSSLGIETDRKPLGEANLPSLVGSELSVQKRVLILENYHRLCESTLSKFAVDMRALSDLKCSLILLGIPSNKPSIITYNSELDGRVATIELPLWGIEDLKKIALGGEDPLKIRFSEETLDFIAIESYGSPFLMQYHCWLSCLLSKVIKTVEEFTKVTMNRDSLRQGMAVHGYAFVGHHKSTYKAMERLKDRLNSEISNFFEKIIENIVDKDNYSPHILKFEDVGAEDIDRQKAANIEKILSEEPQTQDLLTVDIDNQMISVNSPQFILYMRWLN